MKKEMFTPIGFGTLTLKNRIVFAPTSMPLAPDAQLAKYLRVARSGVALIVLADISVQPAVAAPFILAPETAHTYRKMVDAIHDAGAMVSAQLFCPDYDPVEVMDMIRSGAFTRDQVKARMSLGTGEFVTNLPLSRIDKIVAAFAAAATAARDIGFDLIQLHGDRLIGSFSSSVYNTRVDQYGGSAQNRARFACEVTRAVRSAVALPIDYKLAVRQENPHYGNAGVLNEDLAVFVPLLEQAGVDGFHVALANHALLTDTIPGTGHPYFCEQGCFLKYADEVKQYTGLPVCGVGRLSDPDYVEDALSRGRIDLAAMSRQLIADDGWLQKVREGREAELKRCIYCNKKCLQALSLHKPFGCIFDELEEETR